MSSITWTPTELEANSFQISDEVWRCIPANTIRPLVKILDTQADIEVMESMLAESKSIVREGLDNFDPLIARPFQATPSVKSESQFRFSGGPGVLYAAFDLKTALYEHSWHRAKFIASSDGLAKVKAMPLQVFKIKVNARSIDLSSKQFAYKKSKLLSKTDYQPAQALAKIARQTSIQAIKYQSVRNVADGVCLAILDIAAIESKNPIFHDGNWWLSFDGTVANVLHDRLEGTGAEFSFAFEVN